MLLLADGMLGRLVKWLRLLGYDVAYEADVSDLELARRARAEGRILLTRDHALAERKGLHTLLIESQVLEEQVEQVRRELGPPPNPPLARCSVCNSELEPVDPQEIADRVPPYILRTQTEFRRCPGCDKVYWAGTHLDHMRRQMQDFDSG